MKRARVPATQARLRSWTTQQATGVGTVSGLAALLIAVVIRNWPEALLYPYAALLALTAFCGASILWITMMDMRTRGTSGRMRPIRGFDLALGFLLLLPALYGLWLIAPELGI